MLRKVSEMNKSVVYIRFRGFRYLRVMWIFMFLEVFCLQQERLSGCS